MARRFAHTRIARGRRSAWLATSVAALVCALAGACLVTQEVSFEALDSRPYLIRQAPEDTIVRVPVVPNLDCDNNQQGMRFTARVVDRDVEQTLHWKLYLNGFRKHLNEVGPSEDQSEIRTIAPPCLSYEELNAGPRCNRVTLFVSSSPYLELGPGALERGDSAAVEWFVLRGSEDPYANNDDCAPPLDRDAGTAQ